MLVTNYFFNFADYTDIRTQWAYLTFLRKKLQSI